MGVLGSLAGIAEIAKSTFGDGRGAPPTLPTPPAPGGGRPSGSAATAVPSTRPV
jgi:hypothetical protein